MTDKESNKLKWTQAWFMNGAFAVLFFLMAQFVPRLLSNERNRNKHNYLLLWDCKI